MESKTDGFYVDIGVHHPWRFSNTYSLYQKGWSGLNIDADPDAIDLFLKYRPRDININCGVSNQKDNLVFNRFNEPALNSFDEILSKEREIGPYYIQEKIKIDVDTLTAILDKYLPPKQQITIMSIDVEGWDKKVIESNNWELYRPEFLLIEMQKHSLEDIINSEITKYLSERGYLAISKLCYTVMFKNVR